MLIYHSEAIINIENMSAALKIVDDKEIRLKFKTSGYDSWVSVLYDTIEELNIDLLGIIKAFDEEKTSYCLTNSNLWKHFSKKHSDTGKMEIPLSGTKVQTNFEPLA